jgi:hypothetical protein
MADMVREVDVTGKNSIIETFNIPSGVNRKILIELFVENDDKAIYQSSREGIMLEDKPLALEMNLEPTADYSLPPSFEGVLSVSNAESRSVKLSWKPAADNITPHDRIQYLVYLSTESIIGREGEFINIYSLGKGSVLEGDALMSYEYNGDELLLISYEYEGALPSQGTTVTGLLATGRLQIGTPYYFIVKAKDEWGHEEANLAESEEVVVYMLDVAVQGSGTVTSDPAGINCGAKCSEDYLRGTEVTLTAQADAGAAFDGWTGNEQCGAALNCNVIPDEDTLTITAQFCQAGRYYLDMDGDGYGDAAAFMDVCIKPDNHVENGDDCDDSNDTINPVATELCGNDIDEDCDGAIEAVCPPCNEGETRSCGTDAGQCMFGTQECINGVFSEECVGEIGPTAELCDGLDNDCNGLIDDGIGDIPRICGTGACSSTGKLQCLDGQIVDTCVPGEPTAEICDGIDNDCNGQLDDGIIEDPTTCGVGACGATGVLQCTFGALVDTCVEGLPSVEVCDNIDNDCNGLIDDNLSRPTTCGEGACAGNTGTETCTEGVWGNNTCDPMVGSTAEVCDGLDNDCDGSIDETGNALCDNGSFCDGQETCGGTGGCQAGAPIDCSASGDQCNSGECDENTDSCKKVPANEGQSCNDGQFCTDGETCQSGACTGGSSPCPAGTNCIESSNTCEDICTDKDKDGYATEGSSCGPVDCNDNNKNIYPGATEVCDNNDNDCNSATADGSDESWYGDGTNCGVGVCARTGVLTCSGGNQTNTCVPGPKDESIDMTCDGLDGDCDGQTDEDFIVLACDTGLLGECQFGVRQCQSGSPVCIAPAPRTEACDGVDNDCDGSTDENVIIVIGDNDGYGYGSGRVPDNSNLPIADPADQYCFGSNSCSNFNSRSSCEAVSGCDWVDWQFNNQESAESSASNGAQHTDRVRYGPSFTFTMNFSPLLNLGQAWFQLDVSGIQTDIWGSSSITIDGVNHTSMLPTEQGVFGSSVRTRLLNQNSVLDGSVTVSFQGGTVNGGDAIAFDYFELGMTCEP